MPDDVHERKIGEHTVRIERNRCIGSGNCTKIAPEVFELDELTIVEFREDAREIETGRLLEACEVCPVDALIVLDGAGRQVVPEP